MKKFKLLSIFLILLAITGTKQKVFSQANAGPDQVICTDTATLEAVDPFPVSGYWEVWGGSGTFDN
jgi:hypothetical protein